MARLSTSDEDWAVILWSAGLDVESIAHRLEVDRELVVPVVDAEESKLAGQSLTVQTLNRILAACYARSRTLLAQQFQVRQEMRELDEWESPQYRKLFRRNHWLTLRMQAENRLKLEVIRVLAQATVQGGAERGCPPAVVTIHFGDEHRDPPVARPTEALTGT